MCKQAPDYSYETDAMRRGYIYIAGVDEVGRGCLAGPVVAASVRLDPENIPQGLHDSKKLSAKKREQIYEAIMGAADVAIGMCSVEEIDDLNILNASLKAMERAVEGLSKEADFVLVDGNKIPAGFGLNAQAIIKGDSKSLSIAAASIVAKVYRDRLMSSLAHEYPDYGWEKNAGYGTKLHLQGLETAGVTPHHRTSFKPIKDRLEKNK